MAPAWRDALWAKLGEPWDVLVIGGGITGAGILREATRLGLRTLLVEQRDFAWGTSSRSTKLVHGGLRYLRQGRLLLTAHAVREREKLLREGPGLVEEIGFLLAHEKSDPTARLRYGLGLSLYDLLAGGRRHEHFSAEEVRARLPFFGTANLSGAFRYLDAQTDDARLVLRVVREAVAAGGTALNYTRVVSLVRESGQIAGVRLEDVAGSRSAEVRARAVVNATGVWADRLRGDVGGSPRIRPLRGSHLMFERSRLPMDEAVSLLHPADHRLLFVVPWEGVTLVGTTDLDHRGNLDTEPAITPEEVSYLMSALRAHFPSLPLKASDAIATFSGVRPVIGTGNKAPSDESRDHGIWEEKGLVTVTGGKLTTFRLIARDVLKVLHARFPSIPLSDRRRPLFDFVPAAVLANVSGAAALSDASRRRLLGRYAAYAPALVAAARSGELEAIPGTSILWAELRFSAGHEWVVHLQDLLLRRARLGLLLPAGGREHLPTIRSICREELGWSDREWEMETEDYLETWRTSYSLPVSAAPIPSTA